MINEIPEWMGPDSLKQFKKSALPDETPRQAYLRLARGKEKVFNYLWNGWLCPATPVLANFNTDRGLPISCFGSVPEDSLDGIFNTGHELARLSKAGGGTSVNLSPLRGRGAPIRGYGVSNGVIAWAKLYDVITDKVRQGGVRRGAVALYLDVDHIDLEDFLRIRRPEGDPRNQCLDSHHGINISDAFMKRVIDGDPEARKLWQEILKTRLETGEPYLFFKDTANRAVNLPGKPDYLIQASNLCNEINLHSDKDHTFVCCLSSLNLSKWDEWKDTDLVDVAIEFLDDVMEEFIEKASKLPGLENSVRFALKSRALGLGVLGWHTLLQSKLFPYESREAAKLNVEIFKQLRDQSYKASERLGAIRGVPEWAEGTGRRNTHTMAVAPTFSNSIVSGFVSEGINPIPACAYLHRSSTGSYIRKNPTLESLGVLTEEDWKEVVANRGSVAKIANLDPHLKEVFKTAKEIDMKSHIYQAAARQNYIDQGQSFNIYCYYDIPKKLFHELHILSWTLGLKGMYYVRGSAAVKGDVIQYKSTCEACEG